MARAFAFDFDGVIATYSGFKGSDSVEAPNDEVIRAIRTLKERGHTIIVHSTRGEAVLRAYCATHNIPVDYFNENPNEHGENYGKPIAHAYVDDRAVNYHMQTAEELVEQLESFQPHWK